MTIAIFLFPYALFVLIWFFFSAVALYHIAKFGVQNVITFLATFLYIAASVLILFISFTMISEINWSTPLFEGISIGPLP